MEQIAPNSVYGPEKVPPVERDFGFVSGSVLSRAERFEMNPTLCVSACGVCPTLIGWCPGRAAPKIGGFRNWPQPPELLGRRSEPLIPDQCVGETEGKAIRACQRLNPLGIRFYLGYALSPGVEGNPGVDKGLKRL
jgi:hypothetical protein